MHTKSHELLLIAQGIRGMEKKYLYSIKNEHI